MSLLLGADPVTLYPPAGADSHGWALPDDSAVLWQGSGSFQRLAGRSDPLAASGGGAGPYGPNTVPLATVYLPPDAPVADGVIAQVAGAFYVLSQARPVHDPRGTGDLDCWAAEASGTGGWPQ